MKKIICALLTLALLSGMALAEASIIEQPQIIIEMITPSPSPEPVGENFSSEDLIVTLPVGMAILSAEERAGYDAAVSFDFPGAGTTLLLAAGEGCALSFSTLETDQDAASAAREAAVAIFGSDASVEEITLGENNFSSFRAAVGEDTFHLFFLSNGERLLCVGASGLEEREIHAMLTGLSF